MSEKLTQLYVLNPITTNLAGDLMYFVQSGASAAMKFSDFEAQFSGAFVPLSGGTMTGTLIAPQINSPLAKIFFTPFSIFLNPTILSPANPNAIYSYTATPVDLQDNAGIAAYTNGYYFALKNVSSGSNTFTPKAGEFIDGNASLTLAPQQGALIIKTPTQWSTVGYFNAGLGSSPWVAGAGAHSAIGGDGSVTATGVESLGYGHGGGNAGGRNSFAMGYNANTGGDYSFAFGYQSFANGSYQFVFGSNNSRISVAASNSFAFGNNTYVGGSFGFGFGNGVACINDGSWVIGDSNISPVSDSAPNQMNLTFANGFRWFNNNSGGMVVGIDANGNLINKKGAADQSYSRQVPTTGFSITIGAGVKTLVIVPGSQLATGTIIMPAAPIDGQIIIVAAEAAGVTALTVTPNAGQTIGNAPTTISAGGGFCYQYNLANTNWMPIFQNLAGSSSPWVAGTGSNSAKIGDGTELVGGNNSVVIGSSNSFNNGSSSLAVGDNVGIGSSCQNCFISGENGSRIGNGSTGCTNVGNGNAIGSSTFYAFVAGNGNTINGGSNWGIALGASNTLNASHQVAIGKNANVTNSGSMILCDSAATDNPPTDTAIDMFVSKFSNGYKFYVVGGASPIIGLQLTSAGSSLLGTNTNNNASAGYVGEYVESVVLSGAAVSLSNATVANMTSVSLTAGDWDVYENLTYNISVGATIVGGGISTTSATLPDASVQSAYTNNAAATLGQGTGITLPMRRISIASTTTVYATAYAYFAAGTVSVYGKLSARRAR